MTSKAIADYTGRATVGLEDDPELRLEVEAELASHIEAELEAAGGAGDAAEAEAIRHLGGAEDLAGELLGGNFRRLKGRAAARALISFILVPAALLSVLWATMFSVIMARTGPRIEELFGGLATSPSPLSYIPWTVLLGNGRRPTENEQLILNGGIESARTLLAQHPDNPVYRGNYISELLPNATLEELRPALEEAIKAEPNNGRYSLALAAAMLRPAAEIQVEEGEDRLVIKDRHLLDEAMAEMARGITRPEFRRYSKKMLAERLAVLGPPTGFLDSLARTATSAGLLLPDISNMRALAKTANLYARLLATEGDVAGAQRYARAWEGLARHLLNDSFTLIDVLVVAAVIETGEKAAGVYDALGQVEEAIAGRQRSAAWAAPVKAWRDAVRRNRNDGNAGDVLRHRAAILDGMLYPALGEPIDETELRGGRLIEYCLADRVGAMLLMVLAEGILVACWLIGLRWRMGTSSGFQAILLQPRPDEYLRILGYGLVLPVVAYVAMVSIPWLGGRDWSLSSHFLRSMAQLTAVGTGALLLTSHLVRQAARRRCQFLRIAMPLTRAWQRTMDRRTVGMMGAALVLAFAGGAGKGELQRVILPVLSLGATTLVVAIRSATCLARLPGWLSNRTYGTYSGSMARSVVPVYAVFVLLLCWLCLPLLRFEERRLITQTSWGSPDLAGFTLAEDRLTKRLVFELKACAPRPDCPPSCSSCPSWLRE